MTCHNVDKSGKKPPPAYEIGTLLYAGYHYALIISIDHSLIGRGWRYNLLRDGEEWDVDEFALNGWTPFLPTQA